jgi:hypothetical protein
MDNEKLAAEVAEYVELMDSIVAEQKTAIEELEAENASLKEAQKSAAEAPKVDKARAVTMLDKIVEAGFIKENQKEASLQAIEADPSCLVNFLDKLAEKTIESSKVPSIGKSVRKEKVARGTAPVRESDRHFEASFS